ncbi:MAG: hypothetical protein QNK19_03865, partial [Xanthomonadales bacterium]|nr:hypothetical protein [Xanthomonadales bacterium]
MSINDRKSVQIHTISTFALLKAMVEEKMKKEADLRQAGVAILDARALGFLSQSRLDDGSTSTEVVRVIFPDLSQ